MVESYFVSVNEQPQQKSRKQRPQAPIVKSQQLTQVTQPIAIWKIKGNRLMANYWIWLMHECQTMMIWCIFGDNCKLRRFFQKFKLASEVHKSSTLKSWTNIDILYIVEIALKLRIWIFWSYSIWMWFRVYAHMQPQLNVIKLRLQNELFVLTWLRNRKLFCFFFDRSTWCWKQCAALILCGGFCTLCAVVQRYTQEPARIH